MFPLHEAHTATLPYKYLDCKLKENEVPTCAIDTLSGIDDKQLADEIRAGSGQCNAYALQIVTNSKANSG